MKKYWLMFLAAVLMWVIFCFTAYILVKKDSDDKKNHYDFIDIQKDQAKQGLFNIKRNYPKVCSEENIKNNEKECKEKGNGFRCYEAAWCSAELWEIHPYAVRLNKRSSTKVIELLELACQKKYNQACLSLIYYNLWEIKNDNKAFEYTKQSCNSFDKPLSYLNETQNAINNYYALQSCRYIADLFYNSKKRSFFDPEKAFEKRKFVCENTERVCSAKGMEKLADTQKSCCAKDKGQACYMAAEYLKKKGLDNKAAKYFDKAEEMGYENDN